MNLTKNKLVESRTFSAAEVMKTLGLPEQAEGTYIWDGGESRRIAAGDSFVFEYDSIRFLDDTTFPDTAVDRALQRAKFIDDMLRQMVRSMVEKGTSDDLLVAATVQLIIERVEDYDRANG